MLPLSRTCNLADFPDCVTVADWQQRLAEAAWAAWEEKHHIRTREESLVVNYAQVPFTAPGPSAIYRYRGDSENGIARAVPAVWGLSVLEHTEAPVSFLSRAAKILRPGGLLFLTFSYWNAEGPDVAAGHAERRRIYDQNSWNKLVRDARRLHLQTLGGVDWTYHGHKLGDHSLASLVLTLREEGRQR